MRRIQELLHDPPPFAITVYVLTGKVLMQQSYTAAEGYQDREVQLRNFRSGTYYVSVQQCCNRTMQKLMVQ